MKLRQALKCKLRSKLSAEPLGARLDGFDPLPASKRKTARKRPFYLEQGTGIEPAFTAWEAVVLPIYEPCEWV